MSPELHRFIVGTQDHLVRLLGSGGERRPPLVAEMLRRDESESSRYWLQFFISLGIATLGLVVGSSSVLIGAMLIAPLMGPIVRLAMGLATGSPFLVLRSAGRVALSAVVAVSGGAIITLLLPYHELNAEISARAAPTLLDLVIAGFCALAAVLATLRPDSGTAATAAGTAVGISLVPPLCASGYGVGTGEWSVAVGAALLFLTNFVAIVVVGTVAFLGLGFNFTRVSVVALEREELQKEGNAAPITGAVARRFSRVFVSRWGLALRIMMPLVLLAAVFIPLRRALNEVAWQVRVRVAVREAMARKPLRVVQSRVRVEHHKVDVVVVLLGDTSDAEAARVQMDTEIRAASGVVPHLEILAVPDATAFAGLESTLLTPRGMATRPVPTASPNDQLDAARARIRSTLEALWPVATAGEPIAVDVGTDVAGPLRIRVVHLGPALSQDGAEMARRALESGLGRRAELVDVAVPSSALTREPGDAQFVAGVASGVRATAGVPAVNVCVVRPAKPARGARPAVADVELEHALDDALAAHARVTTTSGAKHSVRFVHGSCAPPTPTGADVPPDAGARN